MRKILMSMVAMTVFAIPVVFAEELALGNVSEERVENVVAVGKVDTKVSAENNKVEVKEEIQKENPIGSTESTLVDLKLDNHVKVTEALTSEKTTSTEVISTTSTPQEVVLGPNDLFGIVGPIEGVETPEQIQEFQEKWDAMMAQRTVQDEESVEEK